MKAAVEAALDDVAPALAGELRVKFISVGLADVLDMWLGESEKMRCIASGAGCCA